MKNLFLSSVAASLLLTPLCAVQAAFIIEIDIDGADNGVLTYSPYFSFGGDTTQASQSAPSSAHGMTGGDSIFGGDGIALPDTYLYTYSPEDHGDNLFVTAGTPLGDGNYASGAAGGGPGRYAVYATWTKTSNVDGGLTHYDIYLGTNTVANVSTSLDQNGPGGYGSLDLFGNVWVKLGEVDYTSGPITVVQTPTLNTFVSMRAAGMLFEKVSATGGDAYTGPPGAVVFGAGAEQHFGIAFERDRSFATTNHHAVLRSTNLTDWITTDLRLYSVSEIDTNTDLVTFYSMDPMGAQRAEYLRVEARPKMPVTPPYYVAMTFDDGPHPTLTPQLLDILRERNIRVTFFVTGSFAQLRPHIIRRALNEGHEIGNHTMNHLNLTTLTEPEVIAELAGCRDAVVAAATLPPATMRPPYGARTAELEELFLSEFGYETILWNIDPRDWDSSVSDQEVIDTILDGVEAWFRGPQPDLGPIVLLHDIHARTIAVTPTILDALLAEGYTFVTISERLALQGN